MDQVIKFSGAIHKQTTNTYRVEISYGAELSGQPKEVVQIDAQGNILDWQNNLQTLRTVQIKETKRLLTISKLMRTQKVVTNQLINQLLQALSSAHNRGSYTKSTFTIDVDNKLELRITQETHQIQSFQRSSTNPRKPLPRIKPKLLTLKEIRQGERSKRSTDMSSRVSYLDYSEKGVEHKTTQGFSLVHGPRLAQTLAANKQDKQYKDLLIDYIRNTIKLDKHLPLLYQSLCVNAETNHSLGLQGAGYILREPAFFSNELEALHELQQLYGYSRIKLAIPYVKDASELRAVKEFIRLQRIARSHRFGLYVTLQVPANIITLPSLLDEGVDGVLFDLKNISKLIVGMHAELLTRTEQLYDRAVLKALEMTIEETKKRQVPMYVIVPDKKYISFLDAVPESSYISYITAI